MPTPDRVPLPSGLPPLVFLGPSAPAEDVREILPGAELRPPVRRGDLYRARLFRYSVFVLVDGVFAGRDAVSPREVIDVLGDGAAIVGASSMGALRAVDCAPAGAEGVGRIWRLFRRGTIDSEDEVAVLFNEERPYPALTLSLVGVRLAVRRAERAGLLRPDEAGRLIEAARALHYGRRTLRQIAGATGSERLAGILGTSLDGHDVKRADTRLALARVAARFSHDPRWGDRPRRSRGVFDLLSQGRQRAPDPLAGRDWEAVAPGFLLWMLVSGRASRHLAPEKAPARLLSRLPLAPVAEWTRRLDGLDWHEIGPASEPLRRVAEDLHSSLVRAGELESELFRHRAMALGIRAALHAGVVPDLPDLRLAESRIAATHGAPSWAALLAAANSDAIALLLELTLGWALARAWRRRPAGGGWAK